MKKQTKGLGQVGPLYIGDQPQISPIQEGVHRRIEAYEWVKGNFWVEVVSSSVNQIKYDLATNTLYVLFNNSKRTSSYSSVPEMKAWALFNASSIGVFVAQHIKKRHMHKYID